MGQTLKFRRSGTVNVTRCYRAIYELVTIRTSITVTYPETEPIVVYINTGLITGRGHIYLPRTRPVAHA